jgi:hypothetical protein
MATLRDNEDSVVFSSKSFKVTPQFTVSRIEVGASHVHSLVVRITVPYTSPSQQSVNSDLESKVRRVHRADNLTAINEPTV